MKKFLFLSLTVLFFASSANAQSCSKSAKAACTKSASACTDKASSAQAVLLSGDNVQVSSCETSGNEYRSYTCSASGTTTKQTICTKSGKVTTVKTDKEGNELSTEVAMLNEGEAVTKEATSANPAAAPKACCAKSAGSSACSKSKKAVLNTGSVAPAKD